MTPIGESGFAAGLVLMRGRSGWGANSVGSETTDGLAREACVTLPRARDSVNWSRAASSLGISPSRSGSARAARPVQSQPVNCSLQLESLPASITSLRPRPKNAAGLRRTIHHAVGPNPVDFQELCELADKELTLGLADQRLLERSCAEANGVTAHARQIYWHLRAAALQQQARESSSEAHILELKSLLDLQEQRRRARKERHRWFWAMACFAAIAGTVVFPRLALSAYARGGPAFLVYAFVGVACLALAVVAYVASTYHTHTE